MTEQQFALLQHQLLIKDLKSILSTSYMIGDGSDSYENGYNQAVEDIQDEVLNLIYRMEETITGAISP